MHQKPRTIYSISLVHIWWGAIRGVSGRAYSPTVNHRQTEESNLNTQNEDVGYG
jgi:hypothetical protein